MQRFQPKRNDSDNERNIYIIFVMIGLMFVLLTAVLSSCTISFSNVMTSGTASNVGDDTPTTNTRVDPVIDLPKAISL